jgi:hypothetical protein
MKFGMMAWSKDPEVVATTVFDPATQADYRLETGAPMAEEAPAMEEGDEMEAELLEMFRELDPNMQELVLYLVEATLEWSQE